MNEQDKRFMELTQAFVRLYEEYVKAKGKSYTSLTVPDAIRTSARRSRSVRRPITPSRA